MKTEKIIRKSSHLFDFENYKYQVVSTFSADTSKTRYYIVAVYKNAKVDVNPAYLVQRYLPTMNWFDSIYNLFAGPYVVFTMWPENDDDNGNITIIYWDDMETPIDMLMKLKDQFESTSIAENNVVFDTDNII